MRPIPSRAFAAALLAFAVAGCEAQPVGYFDRAEFRADQAVQPYLFYFQPDSDALATGERERLASYLRTIAPRPGHDILVEVGKSGSPVLDGRRVLALRRVFAGVPARVRVIVPHEPEGAEGVSNAARLSLVRYDLIVVECPAVAQPNELSTPLPQIGCTNAMNRATMAAEKRDLIAPGELSGPDGGASAAAVGRYREGKVTIKPLDSTGS
jgi:type IV pilus biogenesis protein CpaD/CtpE